MQNKKAIKKRQSIASTQTNLPIAEIKEDTVILKDGTLRAVLMVSSINFALKSEDEQSAIVSSYVGFLNSLDFPIQIVIQSRQLHIQPYLEKLYQLERKQINELLRVQIADYRAFVAELVKMGKIMTKRYYVIVSYTPGVDGVKSFWGRFSEILSPTKLLRLKEAKFKKRKEELDMKVRHVENGLSGMGLKVVRLDTQSLIELYYSTYNPQVSFTEPLTEIDKLQLEDIY